MIAIGKLPVLAGGVGLLVGLHTAAADFSAEQPETQGV
jgi:hypothetical protein